MSETREASDQQTKTPEESQVDSSAPEAKEGQPEPAAKSKKSGISLLAWLLPLVIIAAGSTYYIAPDKTKALLNQWLEQFSQQEPVSEPPVVAPVEIETAPTVIEEEIIDELPADVVAASSDEVAALMGAIASLQSEIRMLRNEQQELRHAQQQIQSAQLRSRLVWVANPANRLIQIEQAWKEISTIPTLSSEDRQLAEDMYALASKRKAELLAWQQYLNNWADNLSVKPAENIVPETDNRWLNWLRDQFSIKPSMRMEEKENHNLGLQLRNASQMLALEEFPAADQWRLLRARLQITLSESDNQPLELPEEFSDIKQDISHLRQQAREWLERI